MSDIFFLNGPNPASSCLFSFFSHDNYSKNTKYDKSIDGVLGTRTILAMEGADESTELWRDPSARYLLFEDSMSVNFFSFSLEF